MQRGRERRCDSGKQPSDRDNNEQPNDHVGQQKRSHPPPPGLRLVRRSRKRDQPPPPRSHANNTPQISPHGDAKAKTGFVDDVCHNAQAMRPGPAVMAHQDRSYRSQWADRGTRPRSGRQDCSELLRACRVASSIQQHCRPRLLSIADGTCEGSVVAPGALLERPSTL